MKKEEIELILLKVIMNDQEAIHLKVYRDGTTCRSGAGSLPTIGIGMMTFVNDTRFFDPILEKIPDEIVENSFSRVEEETPNGFLEYQLALFGDSQNGETGERADWGKSMGTRIRLDNKSEFKHPIMGVLDRVVITAAVLTNSLYWDAVMFAKWGFKSSALPEQTMINHSDDLEKVHEDYVMYVTQMRSESLGWDLNELVKGKTYERDGIQHQARLNLGAETFGIRFLPIKAPAKKKSWWKF